MKKVYLVPQIDMFEVASEKGFIVSDFNSGFYVPEGSDYGSDDEWV